MVTWSQNDDMTVTSTSAVAAVSDWHCKAVTDENASSGTFWVTFKAVGTEANSHWLGGINDNSNALTYGYDISAHFRGSGSVGDNHYDIYTSGNNRVSQNNSFNADDTFKVEYNFSENKVRYYVNSTLVYTWTRTDTAWSAVRAAFSGYANGKGANNIATSEDSSSGGSSGGSSGSGSSGSSGTPDDSNSTGMYEPPIQIFRRMNF